MAMDAYQDDLSVTIQLNEVPLSDNNLSLPLPLPSHNERQKESFQLLSSDHHHLHHTINNNENNINHDLITLNNPTPAPSPPLAPSPSALGLGLSLNNPSPSLNLVSPGSLTPSTMNLDDPSSISLSSRNQDSISINTNNDNETYIQSVFRRLLVNNWAFYLECIFPPLSLVIVFISFISLVYYFMMALYLTAYLLSYNIIHYCKLSLYFIFFKVQCLTESSRNAHPLSVIINLQDPIQTNDSYTSNTNNNNNRHTIVIDNRMIRQSPRHNNNNNSSDNENNNNSIITPSTNKILIKQIRWYSSLVSLLLFTSIIRLFPVYGVCLLVSTMRQRRILFLHFKILEFEDLEDFFTCVLLFVQNDEGQKEEDLRQIQIEQNENENDENL